MKDCISDSTEIHRIVNFFDLISTVKSRRLRFSQVAMMADKNEFFGFYFGLINSDFGPLFDWQIDDTLRSYQEAKSHHYVSCWTRSPNDIAVWSLYSPSHDGIQITTQYGRVREAAERHAEKNSRRLSVDLDVGDASNLFTEPTCGPVDYIDFERTYAQIKANRIERFRKRDELVLQQLRDGVDLRETRSDSDSLDQEQYPSGPLLKDFRYSHEKEVRFVLELWRRDDRPLEVFKSDPMEALDWPARPPQAKDCPSNVYVPFEPDSILKLEADTRMEDWKFDAISSVLSDYGLKISRSSAFEVIRIGS